MPFAKSLFFPLMLVAYEISTYLSNDMYLPALPEMMRDLQLDSKGAQLTLTTWFMGAALTPFIMGALSDRFGRKSILMIGGLIYVLTTIACAMASNMPFLLCMRFLQGSMIASMMVPGYASIHELFEKHEAIRLLALMNSIAVLAPAFGPLFGSIVLFFSNWRAIFWIIALWAAITLLFLWYWMPETHPEEKRTPLHLKTLFQNYSYVLTNLKFLLLTLVLGFIFAGFIAWITAGPLLIIEHFHYSPIAFGWIQVGVFAANILGTRLVKYLLALYGVKKLNWIGMLTTLSGGVLMLLFAFFYPQSLYAFLSGMIIYSFGSALCFPTLNRSIIESSDAPMGIRMAVFTVFFTGFAVLGSAMTSLFFTGTILSLAFLIGISIIIAFLLYSTLVLFKEYFAIDPEMEDKRD